MRALTREEISVLLNRHWRCKRKNLNMENARKLRAVRDRLIKLGLLRHAEPVSELEYVEDVWGRLTGPGIGYEYTERGQAASNDLRRAYHALDSLKGLKEFVKMVLPPQW